MAKGKKKNATKGATATKKNSKKIPIAVHRGNKKTTHKNTKAKKESSTVETLPDGWPVTSNSQTSSKSQVLKPGNILHKCSGRDIKLSKNSDTRPNFTIGRGRFLFVLPGLLSLRKPFENIAKDKSQDSTASTNGASASIGSTTSKLFTLGKVRNLETNQPILEIPLPNGQLLSFQGRKVQTTSRYLVLTCKTSGAVNCRHVLQEMVVFGDHSMNESENDISAENNISVEKEAATEDQAFHHYGGSERALDGNRLIRGVKRSRSTGTSSAKTGLSFSQESIDTTATSSSKGDKGENDVPVSDQSNDEEKEKEKEKNVIHLDDSNSSNDSDEEAFKTSSSMKEALPPRKRSSRSIASKKISYTFDDSEDEMKPEGDSDASGESSNDGKDNEDNNSSESEIEAKPKPKPTVKPKRGRRSNTKTIDLTESDENNIKKAKNSASASTKLTTTSVMKKEEARKRKSVASKPCAQSRLSTPSRSPSFRKRRKGVSPASRKKTPLSLAGGELSLKMDDDDEFIFIE